MYCSKCGAPVPDGANFCTACGAALNAAPAVQTERKKEISKNVTKFDDGKYRWVYELNLFKNPTVFFLVWKIFFFIIVGIFAFIIIIDAIQRSGFFPDGFFGTLKILGYFILGMTALVGISYLIYAAIMGGKYTVEFEMDENGVNHKQIPSQAEKARKIGRAAAATGFAAGSMSAGMAGINAQRTEMYSEFSKVKKVKPCPRRRLIKVNGVLSHNQVYAQKEDFEFVKNYIISHCPNIKK